MTKAEKTEKVDVRGKKYALLKNGVAFTCIKECKKSIRLGKSAPIKCQICSHGFGFNKNSAQIRELLGKI
jgi:hypothetical protein